MKKILLPLLFCLLLPCAALAAPDVPTLNLAGLTDLLAKSKGKVIMLNFFATWCPPCRVEIPDLVEAHKKYADKGVLIIGLSVDENTRPVPLFAEKMQMRYPVYLVEREVARAFQVSSIPHNAFYNRDGKLVHSEPGIADAAMLEKVFKNLLQQK